MLPEQETLSQPCLFTISLEKATKQDLEDGLANLQASLSDSESERSRLEQLLAGGSGANEDAQAKIGQLTSQLDDEQELSQRAQSQVELLNQQISMLLRYQSIH